jgi:hypothetical protein
MLINVTLNNNEVRKVTVFVRPTNHLYTRKYDVVTDHPNRPALMSSGELIVSYQHQTHNFHEVKDTYQWKEDRIFCATKFDDNKLLPTFVSETEKAPSKLTVLANAGDEQTCLSGLLEIDGRENEVYLVFFKLRKVKGNQVNMLIDTAYCVDMSNPNARSRDKVNKLKASKGRYDTDKRPFIKLLLNVVEGRKPFESPTTKRKKVKLKKTKASKDQEKVAEKAAIKAEKARKKALKAAAKAQS